MSAPDYELGRWDLGDLFHGFDDPGLAEARRRVERQVAEFERYRERLDAAIEAQAFRTLLHAYADICSSLNRISGFAHLKFAEDTQDQEAQAHVAEAQQFSAELDNRMLFFRLWWKALPPDRVDPLLAAAGDLRYWLEALRLETPYTLSEPEERIINLKEVTGAGALVTLYDTVTNRYTFRVKVDGVEKELTRGELDPLVRSPDPAVRAAAYQEVLRVFGRDEAILGQMYQTRVRDWHSENVGLRKYVTPIAVRNLANDIPDAVVETLLETCRAHGEVFRRYFRLKARWLGVDRLRRYDIYAPWGSSQRTYAVPDSVQMVLDSFAAFDPRLAELAGRVLNENHYDGEVRKGKRSGAFCATIAPELTPWVLQSFEGRARSLSTLAHELGHAVHSLLASSHNLLTQHPALPLAETASTFSEMLLVDRLLQSEEDVEVRRDLLMGRMDDNYATIQRQAYFALFEREAHTLTQAGATVADLSDAYLANLREQFGDSLDLSDEFRSEWVSIPHIFHTPFYVYAYAFGQLLVLALYHQYQEEGETFKPRYLRILEAGGSESPERILASAGLDLRSPGFWQGGFDVLRADLEALEAKTDSAKESDVR
jgi:oligoendopeptidase F